jgi:hypothetical protein
VQVLPEAPSQPTTRKRKHHLKPDWKKQQEKKLRAVVREIERLRTILCNPVSVPLEEPIQRGWVRRHVLTGEAEARPDYAILAEILRDVGRVNYSRQPLFLKKKRRRSRKWIEIKQPLHEILVDRWSTKRQPRPEMWKRYFHFEYKPYFGGFHWFYVFTDAHLIELRVEPHWLTHVSIIDGAAVARDAELHAWMERHHGWQKLGRLKGHYCREPDQLQMKLKREARRDLHRFRFVIEEAEKNPPSVRLPFSLFPFPHVAQCRGTPLRTETVRVRILPWEPPSLPTNNFNKETNEMSYPNTPALIESLMTILEIFPRYMDRWLCSSIRGP